MKYYSFIFLFMICCLNISAQQTRVYFAYGIMYYSFQDSRFSDVQFNTISSNPELGISVRTTKNYWKAAIYGYYLTEKLPDQQNITFLRYGYNATIEYLRKIRKTLYLGMTWDVIDLYRRKTELLQNGSDSYWLSSDTYLSSMFLREINPNWTLYLNVDYGLFTIVNTEPSFSANYQQNIINNGDVTFKDTDLKSFWKLSNMDFRSFGEQINILTSIQLDFRKRLSFKYKWTLKNYTDIKKYPLINARHQFMLAYYFINHQR